MVRGGVLSPGVVGARDIADRGQNHWQNTCLEQSLALAGEFEAWKSLLAFPDNEIRRWEPRKLRMHVYAVPATIARTARRAVVHVKSSAAWAGAIVAGLSRLRALPGLAPG